MSSSNNRSSIDLDDEFGNEEIGMENEVLGAALPADADLEDIGFYVKDMVKDFKQEKGRKLFKNLTLVKDLETLIYLYVGNTLWKGEVDKLHVLEEVLKVQLEDVIKRDIILGERTFQNSKIRKAIKILISSGIFDSLSVHKIFLSLQRSTNLKNKGGGKRNCA